MRLLTALTTFVFSASPLLGEIVINEIMYHPQSENSGEEYIELFNTGAEEADLGGWRFSRGVEFTFPAGTIIPPGGYLVVAAETLPFATKYPGVTSVVGGWTGKLSNSSNTIRLEDPIGGIQDEVDYTDDADWAERRRQNPPDFGHRGWLWRSDADGFGKSLELINAAFDNTEGQNWAASAADGGTPGAANSIAAANIAPIIDKAAHFPLVPRSSEEVTISCRARDDHGTAVTVKLQYRVDGAPDFTEVVMRDDGGGADPVTGDGLFNAVVPAQPSGTIVEFYFSATDGAALTRTWPAPARDFDGQLVQTQNCLYLVDDATITSPMPLYRLVMRAADRAELTSINTNSPAPPFAIPPGIGNQTNSHSRFNATFISRDGTGTKLRYLSGARNRGNGSRSLQPQSFNVQFTNADSWNGQTAIALNTQNTPFQLFGSALYRKAGLAAPESRAVQLRVNTANPASSSGAPAYGFYVCNEVQNSEFAERQFPQDSGGNIYRSQRLFEGDTDGGTNIPNGGDLGLHVPAVDETLTQVELFKLNYRKETNNSEDQWSDLIGLAEALAKGQSGAAINDPITYAPDYLESVAAVADIGQFVRWMAVNAFADNEETNLSNGDGDDYYIYFGEADPRAKLLPYDLDTILGRSGNSNSATHGIFRMVDDNRSPVRPTPMNAFMKHPAIAPLYYAEIKRLLDGPFNPAELDPFCDHILAGVAPVSVLNTIKTFNAARHAHITTLVPLSLSVTTAPAAVNGIPQTTSGTATLGGRSDAVRTRSVKVNGVAATWTAWNATWNAPSVALTPGVNRVLIQAFDADGAEIERMHFEVWYDHGTTTSVSGTLGTTTWTAANGPYQVTAALTVPAGSTLTIQPGTSVFVASGVTLTVNGRILAEGTETQPILFGPVPGGANWGRIAITNTTVESRIAHAHITGNGSSAIDVNNGIAVLDHLTFGNTAVKYLDLDASSFVVSNCVFPTPTAEFEPVHGSGAPLAGGRAIIRDCFFGRAQGYNDVIDFTGGNRPSPILQIYNNVFIGSDDDILDLDGTDAWVEGNIFLDVRRNGSPDSASAISGGNDSTRISEITIVGNLFYNMDHALTAKQGNFYTFLSNTVVDQNGRGSEDTVTAVFNFEDDGTTPGAGLYAEGNIIHSAVALMRHYDPGASAVTLNNNILPLPWTGPGAGNRQIDPLLRAPFQIPTPTERNWRQLIPVIRDAFSLQAASPAIGAGPNGTDLGGVRPLGVSLSGAPEGTTSATAATITVGTLMTGNSIPSGANEFPEGSGWTHYRWRLNGGAWSAETPVSAPISLSDLTDGVQTLEVAGRNDAAFYQDHADLGTSGRVTSATWTVDSTYVPLEAPALVRINEVLALNAQTIQFGNALPDIIELHNAGGAPANIGGWGLTDNSALPFKYTIPAGTTIAPGAYLVIYASGSGSVPQPKTGFGLKREGDTLTLTRSAAAGGGIADKVPFGYQLADHSIGRASDGAWRLCLPTFGAANVLAASGPLQTVKINEWLADAFSSHSTDFIELVNTGTLPVDIGRCYLSDNPAAWPDHFQIRQLTFLAPGGFTTFKADDDEGQGPDHTNFNLSAQQGEIAIFDPALALIDSVVYGPQATDVSEGRTPNGASEIAKFSVPTPGGPNPSTVATTTQVTQSLMGAAHGWKYFAGITAGPSDDGQGRPFTDAAYDDAAWTPTAGNAAQLLYIETSSLTNTESFAKTTVLPGYTTSRPYQTYYFRSHFNYSGPLENVTLTARLMVDDGAVIYLNGAEVARIGIDPTVDPVVHSTRSNRSPDNAVVEVINIPVDQLAQGDNVIAVSVHQTSQQTSTSGSSDVVWGMKLDATVTFGGNVVINEVFAHNATLQNPGGGLAGWIELTNLGPDTADLGDMSISNNLTASRRFVFPTGTTLDAGASLVVYCNAGAPVSATNTGFALNAPGGVVALYHTLANGGGLHDSVAYGRQIPDYSIGRSPDGTGAWTLCVPTVGDANTPAALGSTSELRINELSAAGASNTDFVELFNTGPDPVALGRSFLSDDLTDRATHIIPPLSFIGATGASRWQRWIADGDNSGVPEHLNFELSSTGDAVGLFTPDGYPVDIVGFGAQQAGRSSGRFPDGGSRVLVLLPTPAAANQLVPNGDSDGDGIPDAVELALGLEPADPLDAGMDSDGDGQSNAAEVLAGTHPFDIGDVLRAELATNGASVLIRFTAIAGKTYTVQFKDEITSPGWTRLSDVPAGILTTEVEVPDPASAGKLRRFYRIITPAVP